MTTVVKRLKSNKIEVLHVLYAKILLKYRTMLSIHLELSSVDIN